MSAELDVTGIGTERDGLCDASGLAHAIRLAKEGSVTYLTENGRRVAAIVPVETVQVAEDAMADAAGWWW